MHTLIVRYDKSQLDNNCEINNNKKKEIIIVS